MGHSRELRSSLSCVGEGAKRRSCAVVLHCMLMSACRYAAGTTDTALIRYGGKNIQQRRTAKRLWCANAVCNTKHLKRYVSVKTACLVANSCQVMLQSGQCTRVRAANVQPHAIETPEA